jgi:Tfp pilus assembly protein PilX
MNVTADERISRFLFYHRWFAPTTKRVKPDAFIPHPHVELSVSCTEGLDEPLVWGLGEQAAKSHSNQPTLHGRADLKAEAFFQQGLKIIRDDQPRYHANVTGWPSSGKDAQRIKAIELAAAATLHLKPTAQLPS